MELTTVLVSDGNLEVGVDREPGKDKTNPRKQEHYQGYGGRRQQRPASRRRSFLHTHPRAMPRVHPAQPRCAQITTWADTPWRRTGGLQRRAGTQSGRTRKGGRYHLAGANLHQPRTARSSTGTGSPRAQPFRGILVCYCPGICTGSDPHLTLGATPCGVVGTTADELAGSGAHACCHCKGVRSVTHVRQGHRSRRCAFVEKHVVATPDKGCST